MRETALSLPERLSKHRRIIAMGFAIGALAVPAARASDGEPNPPTIEPLPEFIVAAQEDEIVNEDEEVSEAIAKRLKDLGVNAVKFTAPWTYPTQCAEIDNDLKRYEHAFKALKDEGLIPIVNLIPGGGGGLGRAPITPAQRTCYTDTLISYQNHFANMHPGGRIVFEVPNEPNSETFWQPQRDKNGEWVAPKAVVNVLARAYSPVKKEGQELGIGVTIVGGALASNHNPVSFTKSMGKARQELNRKGPIMDAFSLHPYPKTNEEAPNVVHPDLTTVGFGDLPEFINLLHTSFQKPMSLWLSEWAYNSKVPTDKLHLFEVNPNKSKGLIDETTQAEYIPSGLKIARCNPGIGAVVLFNVIDDPKGQWASAGLMYRDEAYSPKPAYVPAKQEIEQALTDRYVNC